MEKRFYNDNGNVMCKVCGSKVEGGYCNCFNAPKGIILKNINLTGISKYEQINKVREEEKEFLIAIVMEDKENAVEELFDCIQSKIGLIEKVFGMSANDIMNEYDKHLEKLKSRPRKTKKCSNCINCETIEYTDRADEYKCHQANEFIELQNLKRYAKECKCYEEMED